MNRSALWTVLQLSTHSSLQCVMNAPLAPLRFIALLSISTLQNQLELELNTVIFSIQIYIFFLHVWSEVSWMHELNGFFVFFLKKNAGLYSPSLELLGRLRCFFSLWGLIVVPGWTRESCVRFAHTRSHTRTHAQSLRGRARQKACSTLLVAF